MTRPVLFLDDGGVMNNNQVRGEQWPPLVAEFFAPRLGGAPEAWAEANRIVISRIFEPPAWQARLQSVGNYESFDYRRFEYQYQLDWISGMCELVNVPIPDEEQCYRLAVEATVAIIPRVRSAFPGAADAIRALHARGYTLYTASGSPSREIEGYLEGMGVRDCFQRRLYGPDLIDTFKAGPAFYERIFADSSVDPAHALVVDDLPHALAWARQAGARTVLVGAAPAAQDADIRIASLAQLPDIIHRFD